MRKLYTLLFYPLMPLVLARLLWRSLDNADYRSGIGERLGFCRADKLPESPCIWLHAVSVGETIASVPLVEQLEQLHPGVPIVVSTMTPTGAERVRALLGQRVTHVYAPYDLPTAVARFIGRFRPRLLIIMETELWPNMIHGCRDRGVPVVLVNARLSERSARGYHRVERLSRPMFGALSAVAVQTQVEAERFYALGVPPGRCTVTGNIKFDMRLSEQDRRKARHWREQWRMNRPVWIAASTHEGEEEIILAAQAQLLRAMPQLLLILVPRHPERFDDVAALCERAGLASCRLSSGVLPGPGIQVIVGDTMGDLLGLFGVADVAFVGGSLIERGGHNVLEPALWSIPVLSGSHMFNFHEISQMMVRAGGLSLVEDAASLQQVLSALLGDEARRTRMGERAHQVIEENSGALARQVEVLGRYLRG